MAIIQLCTLINNERVSPSRAISASWWRISKVARLIIHDHHDRLKREVSLSFFFSFLINIRFRFFEFANCYVGNRVVATCVPDLDMINGNAKTHTTVMSTPMWSDTAPCDHTSKRADSHIPTFNFFISILNASTDWRLC